MPRDAALVVPLARLPQCELTRNSSYFLLTDTHLANLSINGSLSLLALLASSYMEPAIDVVISNTAAIQTNNTSANQTSSQNVI